MSFETTPCLIAIDWGSSNFRAFLLDDRGNVLERRFAKQGVLKVHNSNFSLVLTEQIGDWTYDYPELPIIMSGMIGSRQGWHEVPYLQCPVSLKQLAVALKHYQHRQKNLWIVPGLRIDYDDGRVDVMRGEETQIMGMLGDNETAEQVFCLPGTHSKWAWLQGDQVIKFTTYMTGELFTMLAKYSILGKLMRGNRVDLPAFMQGANWAKQEQALLSQLFQVRTQVLAGKLTAVDVHSFLSGLLIGCEINEALIHDSLSSITIIANARVSSLYAHAFAQQNILAQVVDADRITANGLLQIAKLAKLI